MGFSSRGQLADRLHFEQRKGHKPTHVQLEVVLKQLNLSMRVWNEVKEVADSGIAALHQGKDLDAKLVLKLIRDGLLPQDLAHTRVSLEHMLKYVDETTH